MKYRNDAGEIESPYIGDLTKYAFDLYRGLNPEKFGDINTLYLFGQSLDYILEKHNQSVQVKLSNILFPTHTPVNMNVLLAFSGGLDSAYQAFKLREYYNVILFHVKNMNYYTNGKEFDAVKEFAEKYNFPLIITSIKQNTKKDNPYRKYWKENSFKNILLYCMMLDYGIHNDIYKFSSGDDLRLDISDAVTGTNVADAKQVTLSFTNLLPYKFVWVDSNVNKAMRIKKLIEEGALDLFYSCVNPGRFNQSNHSRVENKYNVKMEKWNCGVCRKCAFHSLLRHYFLDEKYTQEFIDFCWTKICIGADYVFFNPSLPLETRIKNLVEY